MSEAFANREAGGSVLDVLPGPFEVDRAERIEALTTSARGPMRLAASTLVRLDARFGRWRRRPAPAVAETEEDAAAAAEPAGGAALADTPIVEPAAAEPAAKPAPAETPAAEPAGPRPEPATPGAGDAFPDRLAELAGMHAAGVCEDDAWERWAAGEGEDHLAALDELDRPDRRITRIGARLGGTRRGPEDNSGQRGSRRAAAGVT